jgi:hypothetical protein
MYVLYYTFCCCFETGSHYVVQAGLGLSSLFLSLLSAGISEVYRHVCYILYVLLFV